MSEFINEFGKTNFIIMILIILAILIALIIVLILEKNASKRMLRKELDNVYNITSKKEEVLEKNKSLENEVFYIDHDQTPEEAKEKLEEVTKKLIEDDLNKLKEQELKEKQKVEVSITEDESNLIEHTSYEKHQEEESIISYEELVKSSANIDETNNKVLKDEEESAISIEELYKKHETNYEVEEKIDNPIFEDDDTRRFKNSEVISPVFGVYKDGRIRKKTTESLSKPISNNVLEDEIKKTEDFLEELKKLKSKLN